MYRSNQICISRLLCLVALTLWVNPVHAGGDDVDEAEAPGEAVFKTNVQFIKFTVNGKRNWDNHHYEGRGDKTLVIMGLTRGGSNVIELIPRNPELHPQTVTLTDDNYKRRRVRRDRRWVVVFQATKKLKFTKNKPKPVEKPVPKAKKGANKPTKKAPKKAVAPARKPNKKPTPKAKK